MTRYAISYFVGSKFGGWIVGKDRFISADGAQSAIDYDMGQEHVAGVSQFLRRVVRVD